MLATGVFKKGAAQTSLACWRKRKTDLCDESSDFEDEVYCSLSEDDTDALSSSSEIKNDDEGGASGDFNLASQ